MPGSRRAARRATRGGPRSHPRVGGRFPRRLRVFFEEWDDPMISGIRWVEELMEIAGGDPVFPELRHAGLGRDRIVDPAEVARRDPEVIFASWCGKKVRKARIRARAGWDAVPAVRDEPDLRGEIDLHPAARPGLPDRRRPPAARAARARPSRAARPADRASRATRRHRRRVDQLTGAGTGWLTSYTRNQLQRFIICASRDQSCSLLFSHDGDDVVDPFQAPAYSSDYVRVLRTVSRAPDP